MLESLENSALVVHFVFCDTDGFVREPDKYTYHGQSSTPATLTHAYCNSRDKLWVEESLDLQYLIIDDLVRRLGEIFDTSSTCFPLFS
jgi:hypothetical protein